MLRRLVPAAAVAALITTGVVGCSTQPAPADCAPTMKPGALSDSVTVLGEFGEAPTISAPDDVTIRASQRTVVQHDDNATDVAAEGSLVGVDMAFFDAGTGDAIYEGEGFTSDEGLTEFLLVDKDQANPLSEAVRCLSPGDRAVLALGPEESAQFSQQLGSPSDDAVVGVMDVVSVNPLASAGRAKGLPNGFPAVVTNDEGRPGIVLPPSDAPTKRKSAVRIVGDGAPIAASDGVIAQVLSVDWSHSERMNTWDSGPIGLGSEEQIQESGYGFREALTGATVGSQIVILEPNESGAEVLVVDILGAN